MDWYQVVTIIATLGGLTVWLFSRLDADILALGNRMDRHDQRIDQLYTMFVELLKDAKK